MNEVRPGSRLGRYEIRGALGRGGMGQVLLALDPQIGREVAIKVPLEGPATPEAVERVLAEARITGQLEHPNIVPVYDAGLTEDGRVYYVMKRVEGRGLDRLLAEDGASWTLHRRLSVFLAVCEAVAYAHHRGVLHQDLKPPNVSLGAFGEVYVLDWGLATLTRIAAGAARLRMGGSGSAPHGLSGTPGYIAPERIRSPESPPQPSADQWSLGALLYTLLCGAPPFGEGSARERLDATLRGPPVDVRLHGAEVEVPDDMAELCHRALDPDQARRFPDVAALAEAARRVLEGSERRRQALALVAEADALAPQIAARRAEALAQRAQARALLAELRSYDPVERKRAAWAIEDEAAEAQRRVELDQLVWEQRLQAGLQLVPALHEAHTRLAKHHRAALERAERDRDSGAAARAEWQLRQHDRGHHRRWLAGTGALTLHTDPPGAHVTLWRMALVDRRLVPAEPRALGPTPLVDLELAPGSYLLTLELPGRSPVRYPVYLPRAAVWDGVPPGGTEPCPVYLPRLDELGEDEVYVPAGWFIAGGDEAAADGLSWRRVWVDGFAIQRHPVDNRSYAAFLNGLLDAGEGAEVERLEPRKINFPTHPLDGAPAFGRDERGRLGAPVGEDPERWASCPVTGLDLYGALRYAAAHRRRLPDELEREKAARGVDGRFFPWGDHHDPAFGCCVASQALPGPARTTDFPLDESVYGVRGLAGNVRDGCGNRWLEDGPARDGERLVLSAADMDTDFVSSRGGTWTGVASQGRSAARYGDPPLSRFTGRGLRLTRSIGGPSRPQEKGTLRDQHEVLERRNPGLLTGSKTIGGL